MLSAREKLELALSKGYSISEDGTKVLNKLGFEVKTYQNKTYPHKYFSIRLVKERKTVTILVHRLQALQMFGSSIFEENVIVRHLDSNPSNNAKTNLVLGSHRDNMMDQPEEVRLVKALKGAKVKRKLTSEEVIELRKLKSQGHSLSELAALYEIAKSTVSYIVNNKTYNQELKDNGEIVDI